jgi:hypothetical protein
VWSTAAVIKIFISYRHADCYDMAHQIKDYLEEHLDSDAVFIDKKLGNQPIGAVRTKVSESDILLVLIGEKWGKIWDDRKDEADEDWVKAEIEMGLLTDGVLVIPVLVNGSSMPKIGQLPGIVQPIVGKIGAPVRETNFKEDMDNLLARIKTRHARYCGATRVHNRFPVDTFDTRLGRASKRVRFLVIWSSLLFQFRPSFENALRNNSQLQFLFLDPESVCATQRSIDLGETIGYTSKKIGENVEDLRNFVARWRAANLDIGRVEARYYNATPSRTIYMADENVFTGSHPPRQMSIHSHHTEIFGQETSLFESMDEHFDALWSIGRVIDLG